MRKQDDLSILEPFLQLEVYDWADTIRFKEDILSMVEAPQSLDSFRRLLHTMEDCPGKPLILRAERHSFSPERCRRLVKHIGDLQNEKLGSFFTCLSVSDVTVKREENIYGRFVYWLRSVKRPVTMVFEGDVVLPFLGVGLACDYRMATSDTVFHNDAWILDIPPGFGLLYLLPAYVGFGRAQSLVTMTVAMDAEKAMAWGLLDQIASTEALEASLENLVKHMPAYSPVTLGAIKDLLNLHLPDFDEFFFTESRGIEQAFRREPWNNLPG
jgi:hypothetical protein